jgi:hypothetical protein
VNEEEKSLSRSGSTSSLGAFSSSAVSAILERRKFVETQKDDSDNDDDDEDWN